MTGREHERRRAATAFADEQGKRWREEKATGESDRVRRLARWHRGDDQRREWLLRHWLRRSGGNGQVRPDPRQGHDTGLLIHGRPSRVHRWRYCLGSSARSILSADPSFALPLWDATTRCSRAQTPLGSSRRHERTTCSYENRLGSSGWVGFGQPTGCAKPRALPSNVAWAKHGHNRHLLCGNCRATVGASECD